MRRIPAARRKRRVQKWIQAIGLKRGALHRQLGIPEGEPIPLPVLRLAARAPGVLGRRARFALRARAFRRPRSKSKSKGRYRAGARSR